jgi:hypothetical protein
MVRLAQEASRAVIMVDDFPRGAVEGSEDDAFRPVAKVGQV